MMDDERPNILLIMTDQQRGDALGVEGHPVLQTPYLNQLALNGMHFQHAYSESPVCIPARRTLMTGQVPAHHGVFSNYDTYLKGATLPGELTRAGYQTHLVGKLHLWPHRKLYGFMSADWSDGPGCGPDDYSEFLARERVDPSDAGLGHGMDLNGWTARPWHLPEHLHFTSWCASRAIDFLRRRDPTVPFFLKVSFHQPHPPLTPPQAYWDRYMGMDLPEPFEADWARLFDGPRRDVPVDSWRVSLSAAEAKQMRAGYYGAINHIDDQIGRVLMHVPKNTAILFVSDHGEMLGDHQWTRKRNAFEPSARVPFILSLPKPFGAPAARVCGAPVQLADVMPTLLEVAGVAVPDSVDGKSLLPLWRGKAAGRQFAHGECSNVWPLRSGQQYLTDGRTKYIWYPGRGEEQLFDLQEDPQEMHDLAGDPSRREELERWRSILAETLDGRPEGFVENGRLQRLGGPTPSCLPEYQQTRLVKEIGA